ncbi:putative phage-associated protein [Streptococcus pyogenes]|uniref:conserved phage C-terminal domain-containing protein n=1 Tax=Streptococcus pyogenes TaxID=1314 RepID=UPI0010A0C797|nr:conserved phage C-terminal domain-containing protein [Streptococcus pyogenes]VHK62948.1 putative phage-associated protein [Streptococcus pyogenes]HER9148744.1 conserved phage C-terminal domain-containing protein [Streptococcus pyogenes]
MAGREKTYYFLKLEKDFFEKKEIQLLRKIAGGDTYTIIYLKMLLMALADEGVFYFENIGDNVAEEVALTIREDPENVEVTLAFLQKKGLLEIMEADKYYLNSTPEMVGQITSNALRQRRFQAKKKQLALENNAPLTQDNVEIDIEIDIEKDLDKEREKESILSGKPDYVFPDWLTDSMIEEIKRGHSEKYLVRTPLAYLNHTVGKNYKYLDKNLKPIIARLKEGYTLEEFKHVIDVKTADWKNNPEFSKYLRPETLFGSKFDSYLNQKSEHIRADSEDNFPDLPF